ncbi:glycosyltransferase family 4 protein [Chloroflexota bacterium]
MRVLILHFRSAPAKGLPKERISIDLLDSAGTDGVSLEMSKRQALLEAMGHKVAICSAYDWADFPIPALEFERGEVISMRVSLFGPGNGYFTSEVELKRVFRDSVLALKSQLAKVIDAFQPNLLFVHNVLSLPVHPAVTVSLTELLRETQLPCAAIHHDILSEGAYKFAPTCNFARSIIKEYFPPKMSNLRHWTINTRNKRALEEKGVTADVIHDTMDFDQRLEDEERLRIRERLREKYGIKSSDVVLLVGARLVPNKQTELAGQLTAAMQRLRLKLVGKRLYHGAVFPESGQIVLVLAGRPERDFSDYRDSLFEFFDTLKIPWKYVGNDVRPHRLEDEALYALYPDMYAMADFILYPTRWEGFGNQLLEAFAASLPVVVFEYPVFKEDIAPKGVRVVSLGDTIPKQRDSRGLVKLPVDTLTRVASQMATVLTSAEQYREIVTHNRLVGKKHFGFDALQAHLYEVVNWASSFSHKG